MGASANRNSEQRNARRVFIPDLQLFSANSFWGAFAAPRSKSSRRATVANLSRRFVAIAQSVLWSAPDRQKWLPHSGGSVSRRAFFTRRFEFVAGLPALQRRRHSRLLAEQKTEARRFREPGKVHLRAVFIAGLMVAMIDIILRLRFAPRGVVALEFQSFADGKRRNADARQTEMIGAVVMPSLGARIRPNGKGTCLC